MQLGKLMNFLNECYGVQGKIHVLSDDAIQIQTCEIIENGQHSCVSGCLYLCHAAELSRILETLKKRNDRNAINFLLAGDQPLKSHLPKNELYNIYVLPADSDLIELHHRIDSTLADERRYPGVMNQLLEALYQSNGLQSIVNTAADIVENSILINDISYHVIAKSYRTIPGKIFLEGVTSNGFIMEDIVDSMRNQGVFRVIRQLKSPLFKQQEGTQNNWLFRSVCINDIPVADIAIFADNRPFRYIDFLLTELLCKIIAIELQKDEFYKRNGNMAYSYFIHDLLRGTLNNQNVIIQRAKMLGLKLYDSYWIAVAKNSNSTAGRNNIDYIASQLHLLLPEGKWIVYQQMIIALFSRPDQKKLSAHEQTLLDHFASDNQLSIGLSDLFYDPAQTPLYYTQALHACSTITPEKPAYGVKAFSDVLVYHVIQVMEQQHDYREMLHPSLIKLEDYDRHYNTGLMGTLKQYLICARNITKAAGILNIHRNTLLYRLNRIKEITNLDLENGDEFVKMMFHIKIREYIAFRESVSGSLSR